MKIISKVRPYVDQNGRLRRTRSGHFRFDLIQTNEDGTPYASLMGFRFDFDRRRILPITIQTGGTMYTVAEIAPEEHAHMVQIMCDLIESNSSTD